MPNALSLWSNVDFAGGSEVRRIRDFVSCSFPASLDSSRACTLVVPADASVLADLKLQRILRVDYGGTFYEYRIMQIDDAAGQSTVTVTATPLLNDLTNILLSTVTNGVTSYVGTNTAKTLGSTAGSWWYDVILGSLTREGYSWWDFGTWTPAGSRTMSYNYETVLSFLRRLFAKDPYELSARRGGSKYLLDVTALGSGATQSVCWVGRNVEAMARNISREGLVNSVLVSAPVQTGQSQIDTPTNALFLVTAQSGAVLTLASLNRAATYAPIVADDQLNGQYLVLNYPTVRPASTSNLVQATQAASWYRINGNTLATLARSGSDFYAFWDGQHSGGSDGSRRNCITKFAALGRAPQAPYSTGWGMGSSSYTAYYGGTPGSYGQGNLYALAKKVGNVWYVPVFADYTGVGPSVTTAWKWDESTDTFSYSASGIDAGTSYNFSGAVEVSGTIYYTQTSTANVLFKLVTGTSTWTKLTPTIAAQSYTQAYGATRGRIYLSEVAGVVKVFNPSTDAVTQTFTLSGSSPRISGFYLDEGNDRLYVFGSSTVSAVTRPCCWVLNVSSADAITEVERLDDTATTASSGSFGMDAVYVSAWDAFGWLTLVNSYTGGGVTNYTGYAVGVYHKTNKTFLGYFPLKNALECGRLDAISDGILAWVTADDGTKAVGGIWLVDKVNFIPQQKVYGITDTDVANQTVTLDATPDSSNLVPGIWTARLTRNSSGAGADVVEDSGSIAQVGRVVRQLNASDYSNDTRQNVFNVIPDPDFSTWDDTDRTPSGLKLVPGNALSTTRGSFDTNHSLRRYSPDAVSTALWTGLSGSFYGTVSVNNLHQRVNIGGAGLANVTLQVGDVVGVTALSFYAEVRKRVTFDGSGSAQDVYVWPFVFANPSNNSRSDFFVRRPNPTSIAAVLAKNPNGNLLRASALAQGEAPPSTGPTGTVHVWGGYGRYGPTDMRVEVSLPRGVPRGTSLFVGLSGCMAMGLNSTAVDSISWSDASHQTYVAAIASTTWKNMHAYTQTRGTIYGTPAAATSITRGDVVEYYSEVEIALSDYTPNQRYEFQLGYPQSNTSGYPSWLRRVWAYVAYESFKEEFNAGWPEAGGMEMYRYATTALGGSPAAYTVRALEDDAAAPFALGGKVLLVDPSRGIRATPRIVGVTRSLHRDGSIGSPELELQARQSELTARLVESGVA